MGDRDKLVTDYIQALKELVGADTDSDLARLLSIDKRTVSAWRSRESVPERFLKLLKGEDSPETVIPASQFTELDHRAFSLALFRFARVEGKVAIDGEFRQVWDEFHSALGFWMLVQTAKRDISEALKVRSSSLETALALVMLDDVQNKDESVQRDKAILNKARGAAIEKS